MARLFPVLVLLACSAWLLSCGAFADVFEEPDGEPTMKISYPVISQGQSRQLTVTFLKDPPWARNEGGTAYITDCNPGDDIGCITAYDGVKTIMVTLQAQRDAKIGQRKFEITAAYDKSGQKQQTYSGWAWPFVIPVGSLDGGTGDGGSE
jgi:hypothetical protein